jgi:erythromycin esterase-like protein
MTQLTQFDPIKSAREELTGLVDVHRRLVQRERQCEEAISTAENDLNDTRKIIGLTRIMLDAIKARIAELEKEKGS